MSSSIAKTIDWGDRGDVQAEEGDHSPINHVALPQTGISKVWRVLCGVLIGTLITSLTLARPYSGTVEAISLLGLVLAAFIGGFRAALITAGVFIVTTTIALPDFWQPWPWSRRSMTWIAGGAVAGLVGWVNGRRRATSEQLLRIKSELEDKVKRRTSDLANAVTRLRREMEFRKRAEEELRNVASHTRCILWQAVVEGPANGPVGKIQPDAGKCLLWSVRVLDEEAAQLVLPLDLASSANYFKAWVKSRHPQDALTIGRTCTRAVFAGEPGYSHEYRCFDRDGKIRWLSEDVRVHRVTGNRWHLFGVTTDITDRKKSAQALHLSEQRFALFMDHLPGLAFIKDGSGRYVYMNRACEEWFGLAGGQWHLKRDNELDRPEVVRRLSSGVAAAGGNSGESGAVEGGRHSLVVLRRAELERAFVLTRFPIHRDGDPSDRDLVGGLAIDVTDRLRAQEELLAYQAKLRALAANVTSTEEQQRRKIAATLHDQIGSTLAVAQIRLEMLNTQPDGDDFIAATRRSIGEVVGDLSQAIAQTRSLTCELSPPLLYEAGLGAALGWLASQIQRRHLLPVDVKLENAECLTDLDPMKLIALYQGVRELLTNVVKHAKASHALVAITCDEDIVSVSVSDNGVGISLQQARQTNSFGLFNLRERFNHMGGRVLFGAGSDGGTQVTLVFAVGDGAVSTSEPLAEDSGAFSPGRSEVNT